MYCTARVLKRTSVNLESVITDRQSKNGAKTMKAHAPTVTLQPVLVRPLAGITQTTVYF